MHGGPPSSRSIHTFLTPVAITTILVGLLLSGAARALAAGLLIFVLGVVGTFWLCRALVQLVDGARCPLCDQPTLRRRAVVTFGERLFECESCGARMGRNTLTGWYDASGPEFVPRFTPGMTVDPWSRASTEPEPEPVPDPSTTHAALLRQKRQRTPHSPNGPGLTS